MGPPCESALTKTAKPLHTAHSEVNAHIKASQALCAATGLPYVLRTCISIAVACSSG
jgi:hypothetical protein